MDNVEAVSLGSRGMPGRPPTAGQGVPGPEAVEPQTSLEALVSLLQGNTERVLADAGIAGQGRCRLDLIAIAAGQESEECLDRMRCMLELMDAGLAADAAAVSRSSLMCVTRHLVRLLGDFERWHTLAGNAAYYRDHPEVAAKVARRWREAVGGA